MPPQYKLHRSADFSAVVRSGRRAGRRTLVLHVQPAAVDVSQPAMANDEPSVRRGGPRMGLIVSKNVGNAVTRHAVSRKLRHIFAQLAPELDPGTDMVIRALPAAAQATSKELEKDVRSALRKLQR
nr:ribonuclease P protein component [Corynebacterium sp. TAE3-ERU12]